MTSEARNTILLQTLYSNFVSGPGRPDHEKLIYTCMRFYVQGAESVEKALTLYTAGHILSLTSLSIFFSL
jgi:hypothetical protein